MAEIEKSGAAYSEPLTQESLSELFKAMVDNENKQREQEEKEIRIWNKHYLKYGIPYDRNQKLIV